MTKELIIRERYVDKIRSLIGKNVIKVLTGQRRVGKSYILLQLIDEIKKVVASANIIYINIELEEFRSIKQRKSYMSM